MTDLRESVGESLRVTLKRSNRDTTWREDGPVDLTIAEDAGWFLGVEGDPLFIDTGCCPGPRGLVVYDLSSRRKILDTSYVDYPLEPCLIGQRWLTYLEALGDASPGPDCPDAAGWEKDGLGAGFEEQVWFDLRSLGKTRSGIITCSARQ